MQYHAPVSTHSKAEFESAGKKALLFAGLFLLVTLCWVSPHSEMAALETKLDGAHDAILHARESADQAVSKAQLAVEKSDILAADLGRSNKEMLRSLRNLESEVIAIKDRLR